MLLRARGRAAVSETRLCAFFLILCVVMTGCRSNQEPSPRPRRFVRLDSLLTLHPAWNQVSALDQEAAQFSSVTLQAAALHYTPAPMPPPFVPPDTLPANLAKDREK